MNAIDKIIGFQVGDRVRVKDCYEATPLIRCQEGQVSLVIDNSFAGRWVCVDFAFGHGFPIRPEFLELV